jgi:SRSO17 transposase
MIKLTKRKGFNFFRSYYDVYNELETDKDKVAFIEALLDRQFLGIKPTNLTGMAKFAYISQTNSIDSQVKGYEIGRAHV